MLQEAFSILEHTHHSLHQDEWILMSTEGHSVLLLYHVHLATGCNRTSFSTLSTCRSTVYGAGHNKVICMMILQYTHLTSFHSII